VNSTQLYPISSLNTPSRNFFTVVVLAIVRLLSARSPRDCKYKSVSVTVGDFASSPKNSVINGTVTSRPYPARRVVY